LFDNDEPLGGAAAAETGKPWQEATLEVPTAIDSIEYYRTRAEKFLADLHSVCGPRKVGLIRLVLGVCKADAITGEAVCAAYSWC
jgi:acyl-CoA reductase-like NAD-dependent aldehyde dehydrogenase